MNGVARITIISVMTHSRQGVPFFTVLHCYCGDRLGDLQRSVLWLVLFT